MVLHAEPGELLAAWKLKPEEEKSRKIKSQIKLKRWPSVKFNFYLFEAENADNLSKVRTIYFMRAMLKDFVFLHLVWKQDKVS